MKDGLGEQVLPCHKEQNALLSSANKGLIIYLYRQRAPTPLVSQLINLRLHHQSQKMLGKQVLAGKAPFPQMIFFLGPCSKEPLWIKRVACKPDMVAYTFNSSI